MIPKGALFGVQKITSDPWGRLVWRGAFELERNWHLSNELVNFVWLH